MKALQFHSRFWSAIVGAVMIVTRRSMFIAASILYAGAISAQSAAAATASLLDVQFGEKGARMRIALVCSTPCVVTQGPDGGYLLEGVETRLSFDLDGRSKVANALRFEPAGVASALRVDADAALSPAGVRRCEVGGAPATCVDFTFDPRLAEAAPAGAAASANAAETAAQSPAAASVADPANDQVSPQAETVASEDDAAAAADADAPSAAEPARIAIALGDEAFSADGPKNDVSEPHAASAALDAESVDTIEFGPPLRDGFVATTPDQSPAIGLREASEGLPTLAAAVAPITPAVASADRFNFPPPERLEPPAPKAGDAAEADKKASQTAADASAAASAPTQKAAPTTLASLETPAAFLATSPAPTPGDLSVGAQASSILGLPVDQPNCVNANNRLQDDAWALDAMVAVGFCKAADGALADADADFARLIAFTPDNYEALVGRALVAEQLGRREEARQYYQDALDALPPMNESRRIAEAMDRL